MFTLKCGATTKKESALKKLYSKEGRSEILVASLPKGSRGINRSWKNEEIKIEKMAKRKGSLGPLYVGIDLGNYRTSMTSSSGLRKTILNVVGWPKDDVSRKLFSREVVFGQEALRHSLALNTVRPFEKGVIKYSDGSSLASPKEVSKYKEAAMELVKYVVSLAILEKGCPVYGVIGAPARASVINRQALVEAASETLESVIVVSEPFSVAYGLDLLEDALIIDIGAGTVDLCRMHGALPEEDDQITLTTAGDYVDELLLKLVKESHPEVQLTTNMAREIKERYGFVSDTNDRVIVKVPVYGKPRVIDITEECRQACRAIVPPILEAARILIATCDPKSQENILKNVVLAGGMSQLKGFDKLIEEGLEEFGGGRVCRVKEPAYAGAEGALKLAHDMPFWREDCSESQAKSQAEKLSIYLKKARAKILEEEARKELDEEIEFFNAEIDGKLKEYIGKYVAIKNHQVIAVGDTYGEVSEKVNLTKYAKERCILICKVEKERPIHFVSVPLSIE